jgi:hypothetical protein
MQLVAMGEEKIKGKFIENENWGQSTVFSNIRPPHRT